MMSRYLVKRIECELSGYHGYEPCYGVVKCEVHTWSKSKSLSVIAEKFLLKIFIHVTGPVRKFMLEFMYFI